MVIMRPACILIVEEVLPEVRRGLARDLYSHGTSQESIADLLGVSQAMVSRYLKVVPGYPRSLDGMVVPMVKALTAFALQGATPDGMTEAFCRRCSEMIADGALDARYAERFPGSSPPRCERTVLGDERSAVIEELVASARYLSGVPLPDLVPAVKMNLAQCLRSASGREDVASFPGRLQDVDGLVRLILPPQFGASRHLAEILLRAHSADRSVMAVANIRFSRELSAALSKELRVLSNLERVEGRIHGIEELVSEGYRLLADPGDFGIEPCLYVLGRTSLEVARELVTIQKTIGEGGN